MNEEEAAAIEAQDNNIPEPRQLELARHPGITVRKHLARNPGITEAVQAVLAQDQKNTVRAYLANNRNVSEDVLTILARDNQTAWVGQEICLRRQISVPVQLALSRSPFVHVRADLARLGILAESVQPILADDVSVGVRRSLAQNSNLMIAAQVKLFHDTDDEVRLLLFSNKCYNREQCELYCELKIRNFIAGHT